MIENEPRFSRDPIEVKRVVHDHENVNVVRVGFPGHERAEYDDSLQAARCSSQFIDAPETHADQLALKGGLAELGKDLV